MAKIPARGDGMSVAPALLKARGDAPAAPSAREPDGAPTLADEESDESSISEESEESEASVQPDVDSIQTAIATGGGWYLLPDGEKVRGRENVPADLTIIED